MMNDIGVDNKQQYYIIIIIIIIIKINVAIRAKYFIFCRRNKIGFILFCFVFCLLVFRSFVCLFLFSFFFFISR